MYGKLHSRTNHWMVVRWLRRLLPLVALSLALAVEPIYGQQPAAATGAASEQAWGTLTGRFVYGGSPPEVRFVSVPSDGSDFILNLPKIPDQSLVVDSKTKGIKNIVIYARRVSRVHPKMQINANEPFEVRIKNCVFHPHVAIMLTRRMLVLQNNDPIAHTGSVRPPLEMGMNELLGAGERAEYHFRRQEATPVAVRCRLCPWTGAYLLPRDNPYFAVTDGNGRFEIENLPAGEEIEFIVWHEKASGRKGRLAAGPLATRGRFRVTISAGLEKDLETIEIAPSAFLEK